MGSKPSRYKPPVLKRIRTRERRYPIWSVRTVLVLFVIGLAVAAPLVFIFGHGRLLVRMELLLGVVAAGLFLFLTVGLYSGARVRKQENVAGELKLATRDDWIGNSASDLPDVGGCLDVGDDGCAGVIGGLLLGLVLLVLLVVGLYLFVNVALIVFFLLAVALGWVFQRALRQVFARSKRCRGDLAASLAYAGFYTVLYTGWLFALLVLAERLTRDRGT